MILHRGAGSTFAGTKVGADKVRWLQLQPTVCAISNGWCEEQAYGRVLAESAALEQGITVIEQGRVGTVKRTTPKARFVHPVFERIRIQEERMLLETKEMVDGGRNKVICQR